MIDLINGEHNRDFRAEYRVLRRRYSVIGRQGIHRFGDARLNSANVSTLGDLSRSGGVVVLRMVGNGLGKQIVGPVVLLPLVEHAVVDGGAGRQARGRAAVDVIDRERTVQARAFHEHFHGQNLRDRDNSAAWFDFVHIAVDG